MKRYIYKIHFEHDKVLTFSNDEPLKLLELNELPHYFTIHYDGNRTLMDVTKIIYIEETVTTEEAEQ